MEQYESEARTPKQDLVKEMAHTLDVSPRSITVPEIDSYIGLMHTLFSLKNLYGLKIREIDQEVCQRLISPPAPPSLHFFICSTHGKSRLPVWDGQR